MAGSKQAAALIAAVLSVTSVSVPAEANRRCGYDRYGYNAPDFSGRYRYYREGRGCGPAYVPLFRGRYVVPSRRSLDHRRLSAERVPSRRRGSGASSISQDGLKSAMFRCCSLSSRAASILSCPHACVRTVRDRFQNRHCRIEAPRASLGTGGGVPRQIRDGAIAESGRRGVHSRPEQSTR